LSFDRHEDKTLVERRSSCGRGRQTHVPADLGGQEGDRGCATGLARRLFTRPLTLLATLPGAGGGHSGHEAGNNC
jgi:hypothetical protein